MGQAAAYGAAVANHAVRHQTHRRDQKRAPAGGELGIFDIRLAGERLDRDATIPLIDAVQVRNPVDIDEMGRPRESEVEQRDQRLAAGQDLRVLQ